ncbi:MAG: gephyrin-like molybdotransferase Glp [Lysobacteraceae bacterium]
MIDYARALEIILGQSTPLPGERIPASAGIGRILATPVRSPEDLPPFANSAMDGFALHAGAGKLATGTEFRVDGSCAAGDGRAQGGDGAWEIMTGARVPDGLDTIVPVEQVEVLQRDAHGLPQRIRLLAEVAPGQHLRRSGEDVARGAQVAASGELLRGAHLGLLAALGVATVEVVRRPRVAVINTGRELVCDPAQPLQPGQIRESNSPLLIAQLATAGAEVVWQQVVSDEPEAFATAVQAALDVGAEVLISTGAVSMGRYDFVPDSLQGLGAQIHFHKVRIRPGKPLLFATLAGGQLYFGLPGNPASSAVGLRFFVEPALRRLLGLMPERPLRVPLATSAGKSVPMRRFLKARLACDGQGQLRVHALSGQESFKIAPLLQSNAWMAISEDAGAPPLNALVEVYPIGHLQGIQPGTMME